MAIASRIERIELAREVILQRFGVYRIIRQIADCKRVEQIDILARAISFREFGARQNLYARRAAPAISAVDG